MSTIQVTTQTFSEDVMSPTALKARLEAEESAVENKPVETPQVRVATPKTAVPTAAAVPKGKTYSKPVEKEITLSMKIFSALAFFLLIVFANARELYRRFVPDRRNAPPPGYAPMLKDFDDLYQRRFYRRVSDCFSRPIDSRPSRIIGVMERVSHDENRTLALTGRIIPAINMASYNYLGFAEDTPYITHAVIDAIDDHGVASCSASLEVGQHTPVATLEREFAAFIGKEDAVVCGMGFGTNLKGLPALFGPEALVVSDSLNHSSLVNGVRSSGAKVKVFKHDHFDQLETILREAVVLGRNPHGEYVPYKRIVIVVEGIYSMEGEIIDLKTVVELKKKYKALLFVDEAHSVGAIGRTGRGVCEYAGVDPKDVDILMGTFTKSFGAIGGYIASTTEVIQHVRTHSSLAMHCDTLAGPCAEQVLAVLRVLQGKDGTELGQKRIHQLKENSRFLRQGFIKLGFTVLGNDDSPVVPVMVYNMGKLCELSRKCLERGLAIVLVGYPATPLMESRVRFCVSAAHTRKDLQHTLDVMEELSKEVTLAYDVSQPAPIKA